MKHVSINDYQKRPIFLHAVNRELHDAVGLPVAADALLKSIRIFSLLSDQNIFCNVSQVHAVFYDRPEALVEFTELSRAGLFTAHADYGSVEEFRESRAEKFDHARGKHPAFFSKPSAELLSLPLSNMGKLVQTTEYIEKELIGLVEGRQNQLYKSLNLDDRNMLRTSENWLMETLKNREQKALTFDVFEQSQKADMRPKAVGAVRRALSQAYIGSYTEPFDPLSIWGYFGINRFDRYELFAGLNLVFAESIFAATGLKQALEAQPAFGQFDRLSSLATEEMAYFRQQYHEFSVYLDAEVDVTTGYYTRNSQVRSNIQNMLQLGTLRPIVKGDSFRDKLLVAATAIEKTMRGMSQRQRPLDEPKLYTWYPDPIVTSKAVFENQASNSSTSEGGKYRDHQRFPIYNTIAIVVIPFLCILSFLFSNFYYENELRYSVIIAILTGFSVAAILIVFHPAYFYRRIAGFGLGICVVGGWSFQFKVEGVRFLGESFIYFETGSPIPTLLTGFFIFFTGLVADFLQRADFTFKTS